MRIDHQVRLSSSRQAGFTLLELLVGIIVAVILLLIAVPALERTLQDARLLATRDQTINAINFARATAITNNSTTQLCPYNPTHITSCGSDWSQGWILFETLNGNTTALKAWPAGTSGTQPTLSVSPTTNTITFNPTPPYVVPAQITEFKLCDSRGASAAINFELQLTGYLQTASQAGRAMDGTTALTCP